MPQKKQRTLKYKKEILEKISPKKAPKKVSPPPFSPKSLIFRKEFLIYFTEPQKEKKNQEHLFC